MAKPADKSAALWVLRRLREAGFEALFAGGCVRDMLLGAPSTDYDIATDATPRQVSKLFHTVLLVGAKFGVAMVIHKDRMVEVTTFRSDLSYSDGRRPDAVRFSASPSEDARRRDFTVNGMFYDPIAGKVIDTIGGRRDLRRRVIRTIGRPKQRFAEDYLRMIRAVRFAVRLGFKIAPATAAAIRRFAPKIVSISGERICDELCKMLSGDSVGRALRKLRELDLAEHILPELFEPESIYETAAWRVEQLARMRDANLALGALLAELPAASIRRIVRRWGGSNDLRSELCFYSEHLSDWRSAPEMALCDLKRLMSSRHFENLRALWRVEERRLTGRQLHSRRIARRVKSIPADEISPAPLVTGDDLKKLGLPEGPRLGRILRTIYDAQLNEDISTSRQAVAMARRLAESADGPP